MKKMIRHLLGACALVAGLLPSVGSTQNQFSAAITVNDRAITQHDIEQRKRFFQIIRRPGNLDATARESLIEDSLRMQAARTAGISASPAILEEALESFAGRADLTLDEFVRALEGNGVARQTLVDFVEPAILWREVIRTRFAGRGEVSEAEIDRALGSQGNGGGLRVLISEVILPARPGERGEVATARRNAERIQQIKSTAAFSAEARRLSVSGSREKGGRLDWLNLSELPPGLGPILTALRPGEVTQPIPVPNALILFQLRAVEEVAAPAPQVQAVEYATLTVADANASDAVSRIDVCDDLYGLAKRYKVQTLDRRTATPNDVPDDIRVQLAALDRHEIATSAGAEPGTTRITVMCGRTLAVNDNISRDDVAESLRQRRLGSLAEGYMSDLRAAADIKIK